jgi:hypothetical protein
MEDGMAIVAENYQISERLIAASLVGTVMDIQVIGLIAQLTLELREPESLSPFLLPLRRLQVLSIGHGL